MLDVTGSMCDDGQGPCTGGAKLAGLKDAARDLVKIVVQDNQSNYKSRVALVPFSTRIRVERDNGDGALMKKLTNLDPKWSGWLQECLGQQRQRRQRDQRQLVMPAIRGALQDRLANYAVRDRTRLRH